VKASLLTRFAGCLTLKRHHHLASCRCHSALDLGLAAWVFTLSPPFIVRVTAHRHNNVHRQLGYLCVRLLTLSLDSRDDAEAQLLDPKYEI
jgi:hypothetical protein